MGLYKMETLLQDAFTNHYAIPAFNFDTFDILFAIFEGSTASNSPLIVQITETALNNMGIKNVVDIVRNQATKHAIPTALHLDHGENMDVIERCIRAGFTSVMVDGSSLSFLDNVAVTKKVVDMARPYNVTVEAEIGHVGMIGTDNDVSIVTSPKIAQEFVLETKVDVLAVSVGSVHGVAERRVHLDLERLEEIHSLVKLPLVLHGSSGVAQEDLLNSRDYGITKTNVETELRLAFRNTLYDFLRNNPSVIKPRVIMSEVRDAVAERVVRRQELMGSSGKAVNFKLIGGST